MGMSCAPVIVKHHGNAHHGNITRTQEHHGNMKTKHENLFFIKKNM
jgi:hypothetical protein